jgi:hypothetical protein
MKESRRKDLASYPDEVVQQMRSTLQVYSGRITSTAPKTRAIKSSLTESGPGEVDNDFGVWPQTHWKLMDKRSTGFEVVCQERPFEASRQIQSAPATGADWAATRSQLSLRHATHPTNCFSP